MRLREPNSNSTLTKLTIFIINPILCGKYPRKSTKIYCTKLSGSGALRNAQSSSVRPVRTPMGPVRFEQKAERIL
jgi:hypothetical protein